MSLALRLMREPLVHFLAIGAVLFMVFNWRGGGAAGGDGDGPRP